MIKHIGLMTILYIFIVLQLSNPLYGDDLYWDVLIYCDGKAPATGTHWKAIVPDLNELVVNFKLIGQVGAKKLFHCRLDKAGQYGRIKNYIDNHPELGIKYWVGTGDQCYVQLYQDSENQAIAMRALKYPVEVEIEGITSIMYVSVYDAINTYGVSAATIQANPQLLAPSYRWLGE